ncbi:MAG: CotH kinase family protein [Cyclobacteriaceae bacterium]|nr:CotH kinase family protein [Cyclobacteriaceae bacterium]UYN86735.1 MAG: CotH kinase family protein [Cyclobacteriaceae bacterium]
MKRLFLISIILLTAIWLSAQVQNPGTDAIFRPSELAIIRLTLTPQDKALLLDPANVNSEKYLPAIFQMTNSQLDTILEKKVGIRLRGNSSRLHEKKPFKIDFREFGGKKFYNHKKFNLKPNVNDPTQVREPLSLLYFREMNVPAARTFPLRLYINDEYMGVYINVEQLDDEFLKLRYGNDKGFLYKCSFGANLLDDGQIQNAELYESEINKSKDTRAELEHFVNVLNNTPARSFVTEIEKVFNVDLYLRQLAVEAMLGHWDGYSYNMNNYYLFYNGNSGLFEYFPYDADNTWGIDWLGRDWAKRDLTKWPREQIPLPLTKRLLNIPDFKRQYEAYLKQLLDEYFNASFLVTLLNSYKSILDQAVKEDTYFGKAFGFTHADFLTSFETRLNNNHVRYGLKEFLEVRRRYAFQQVQALIPEDNRVASLYPNPSNQPFVYYSTSEIFTEPQVYNSTGIRMPVTVSTTDDQRIKISLPDYAGAGLYYLMIDGKVLRWAYY